MLSWALPQLSPRVERAFYVRTSDLKDAVLASGQQSLDTFGNAWTLVWTYEGFGEVWVGLGDAVVMVDGTQTGMDLGRVDDDNPYCAPASDSEVTRFMAFFDAETGSDLGVVLHGSDTEWLWTMADELAAINPPVRVQPSSIPEATHWRAPSPTPFSPPPTVRSAESEWLEEGEIPLALVDTARQMPVVRGAWWRYRETSVREAVVWSERVFTSTVTDVRRIAGDEVGVQRSSATGEHYADVLVPHALIALPHEMWNGSGAAHGDTDLIDAVRRWLQTPDPPGDGSTVPSRARPPAEFMRIPPVPGTRHSYWDWTEPDLVAVRGPAAEFQGCSVLRKIQGGGNVSSHWWCPGVGFVRMLDPGCGGTYGNVTVTQLEAWHIPRIVTVP